MNNSFEKSKSASELKCFLYILSVARREFLLSHLRNTWMWARFLPLSSVSGDGWRTWCIVSFTTSTLKLVTCDIWLSQNFLKSESTMKKISSKVLRDCSILDLLGTTYSTYASSSTQLGTYGCTKVSLGRFSIVVLTWDDTIFIFY